MRRIKVGICVPVVVVLCCATTGCAGRMLNGTMYSLADNVAMPMQIQVSQGHGKMTAHNPKTDEHFEGTYSAVQPGQTQVTNAWANSAWGGSTQLSATSGTSSNVATAIATLIGDKGTTLDCVMQIQPGFSPHGIGTARDNAGREYRIQF